jgi:hypothetical protein
MKQARWAVTVGLLLAAGPAAAADERGTVRLGGGVFAPYDGNPGGSALLGAEGGVSQHLSVGGEVEYRNAQMTVVGVGVLGLAGLDLPLGDRVSLFAEGRVSGDVETTLFSGDQVGGVSGLSGARFTF